MIAVLKIPLKTSPTMHKNDLVFFFYIGCMTEDHLNHPHHSPDFMMNEDCLLIAAKAVGTATIAYLMD